MVGSNYCWALFCYPSRTENWLTCLRASRVNFSHIILLQQQVLQPSGLTGSGITPPILLILICIHFFFTRKSRCECEEQEKERGRKQCKQTWMLHRTRRENSRVMFSAQVPDKIESSITLEIVDLSAPKCGCNIIQNIYLFHNAW